MYCRHSLWIVIAAMVTESLGAMNTPLPQRPRGEIWAGAGYLAGDTTYQIGGAVTTPAESYTVHFPISELVWPMNVAIATVGGNIRLATPIELSVSATRNLSDAAGDMEDSDWSDPDYPNRKTIYSRSDTTLDTLSADIVARYAFLDKRRPAYRLRGQVGLGYRYQSCSWEARDTVQWSVYPELSGSVSGLAATYETTAHIPHIRLTGNVTASDHFHLVLDFGLAPYVRISDRDDHVLRSIESATDADGMAALAALQLRYSIRSFFLLARIDALFLAAQGTGENTVYGGEAQGDTWTIEHEITSRQGSALFGAGLFF